MYEGEWEEMYSQWFEQTYGRPIASIGDYYDANSRIVDMIWDAKKYSEEQSCEFSLIYREIEFLKITTECHVLELGSG